MTTRADRERRTHDAFRLLAAGSVDGRIAPDDATALEAHLARCPDCRADLQAMIEDHAWLADPGLAMLPKPTVRDFVLDAARSRRVPRTSSPARPWAALLAASLIIAVGGAVWLARNERTPAGAAATGSANPTEIAIQSAVPNGACAPRPPGLSAWWKGDGDLRNSVGAHDATAHGNVTFSPGIVNDALTFDGISAYAEVLADPGPDVAGEDFTIQLWVRFHDLTGEPVLIEKWHDVAAGWPANQGWTLQKTTNGGLAFFAGDGTDQFGTTSGTLPLRTDVWYQVAVRRSDRELSLLVNGVVVDREVREAGPLNLHVDAPLTFGRRSGGTDFLNGQLDEVQVVIGTPTPSDAQIEAVYEAGSAGTCSGYSPLLTPLRGSGTLRRQLELQRADDPRCGWGFSFHRGPARA